nr:Uma2 family endonuclease [Micromonospora sp. DSM 115978]
MSVMAIRYEDIPVRDDGFTVDDLDEMPDDGRRYELVDGVLLVSPSPRWEHQSGASRLGAVLVGACPHDFEVLQPIDVRRGDRTSVQPDLSVVRAETLLPGERFAAVPVLAVEILSPSSLGVDKLLKRDVYARLGVPRYWIIDLDRPSVTVLELDDGAYREGTVVQGDDLLDVSQPFPVAFRPSDLTRRRGNAG